MKYAQGSFITVPSRNAISGIHPTAQALYMWLCSYANETGNCYPSRKSLSEHVGCSESMIDNMLEILIERGLLKKKGRKEGDRQLSNLYTVLIVDTLAHSGTPPSTEYATPSHDVRTNSIQLTQSNELNGASRELKRIEVPEEEEKKIKNKPKYPHHLEVFGLWGKFPKNWLVNNSQKQAAENLYEERGIEAVKDAIEWYEEMKERQKDNPHFYLVTSPWDLDAKWDKLEAFSNKT